MIKKTHCVRTVIFMAYLLSFIKTVNSHTTFNKPDASAVFDYLSESVAQIDECHIPIGAEWSCPIAYEIDPQIVMYMSPVYIFEAMDYISKMTGWSFVERTNEDNYMIFTTFGARCSSCVGQQGGPQFINLYTGCGFGATLHTIMLAIGSFHEHQREDRDQFVFVNEDNIFFEALAQFAIQPTIDPGPYDYGSITHYNKWQFTFNGLMTIKPIGDTSGICYVGQRFELTKSDIRHLNDKVDGQACSTLLPDPCVHSDVVVCAANTEVIGDPLPFQQYELIGQLNGRDYYRSKRRWLGAFYIIYWFGSAWRIQYEKEAWDYLYTFDEDLFSATWFQYNVWEGEYQLDPAVSIFKMDCRRKGNQKYYGYYDQRGSSWKNTYDKYKHTKINGRTSWNNRRKEY